jgi:hypothetical protein
MFGLRRVLTNGPTTCLSTPAQTADAARTQQAHTEAMPEEMPWADPVVVPDDIRALQTDIDAYHRELRLARRRRRRERLTGSAVWRRWSFPVGVLTGALALAAVVVALLAVDGSARPAHRDAVPLGSPSIDAGRVGGLLPTLSVTSADGATVPVRSLRPALLVLVPVHCNCTALLDSLAGQAAEVQLQLVVIGPSAPDAEVAALPGQLHHGNIVAGYDHAGALSSGYDAHGVTALVVARDGVVTYSRTDVTVTTRLELPLQAALLLGTEARS